MTKTYRKREFMSYGMPHVLPSIHHTNDKESDCSCNSMTYPIPCGILSSVSGISRLQLTWVMAESSLTGAWRSHKTQCTIDILTSFAVFCDLNHISSISYKNESCPLKLSRDRNVEVSYIRKTSLSRVQGQKLNKDSLVTHWACYGISVELCPKIKDEWKMKCFAVYKVWSCWKRWLRL